MSREPTSPESQPQTPHRDFRYCAACGKMHARSARECTCGASLAGAYYRSPPNTPARRIEVDLVEVMLSLQQVEHELSSRVVLPSTRARRALTEVRDARKHIHRAMGYLFDD